MNFKDMEQLSGLLPEVKEQKVRLIRLIEQNNEELLRRYYALEKFIQNAPDSLTRSALRMRFIDGKSWQWIAWAIGGKQSASSVRMMCRRYLATVEMPEELSQ